MKRALIVAAALLLGAPATAQDHSHHTGHTKPMPQAAEATPADAGDWAADALHDPKAMAEARAALFRATRDSRASLVRLDQLEWRMGKAKDGLAWQGRAWTGGDLDRFLLRSEGAMEGGEASAPDPFTAMMPGSTITTWMPKGASSRRSVMVMPWMACLVML